MSQRQSKEDQETPDSKNLFLLLLNPRKFNPDVGFFQLYQTPLLIAFAVILGTFVVLYLFFGNQQEVSVMLIVTAMPALLSAMLTRHWFTEYRRAKSMWTPPE